MSTAQNPYRQCPNFLLCEGQTRSKQGAHAMCTTCSIFGWERLLLAPQRDTCAVCLQDTATLIQFPACTHFFCVPCTQKLLLWDERFFHLSAGEYGCPPCPNGCQNPVQGRQCECRLYTATLESWRTRSPAAWQQWNDDEEEAIDTGLMQKGALASRRCPLCRAVC